MKVDIRDSFIDLLQNGCDLTIEAKIRVSRELYSNIRLLVRDYRELNHAVNNGYASDDDLREKTIAARQIDFYRELLLLLGFDPFHDPELGFWDLRY